MANELGISSRNYQKGEKGTSKLSSPCWAIINELLKGHKNALAEWNGESLRTLRISRKMNRAELANALGSSASSIYFWENGRCPSIEYIERICRYFGAKLDTLFTIREGEEWGKTS